MKLLLYCILVLNPNRAYELKWQRDTRVIQLIHTDLRVLTLGLADLHQIRHSWVGQRVDDYGHLKLCLQ